MGAGQASADPRAQAQALIRAGMQRHAAIAKERATPPFSPDGFVDEYYAMTLPARGRVLGKQNRGLRKALDELVAEVSESDIEGTALQALGEGEQALQVFRDAATVRWVKNVAKAKAEGKSLMVKYYAKRMPVRAADDPELAQTLTQFIEADNG